MNTQELAARTSDARRAHIEALIADYPEISEQEVLLVRNWFERQASALDVAQVGSRTEIAAQYRAFRADHIDRFEPRDWGRAVVAVCLVVVCLAGIMWRAF